MRRFLGIVLGSFLLCCVAAGQNRRIALRGQVHPVLRSAADLGRADSSLSLQSLRVVFGLTPARQTELEALLVRQQDPASIDFHKWLSPEDFASRFGTSEQDIRLVTTWLESAGLRVTSVARGRNSVSFIGPLPLVEAAFATRIHRYLINGEIHFANSTEVSVPAGLENTVTAVHGLHDFRLRAPHPRFTSVSTGSNYLAPDDFATIYNLKPLYGRSISGSGQKIVVVGQTQVPLSDLQLFRSSFNLPALDPQIIPVPGLRDPGVSPADVSEAILDIDWAGAVARNASILYVYSADVTDALYYAIDQNLAPVISMSYGLCEAEVGNAVLTLLRSYAQRAAAQGITWVAASGDAGAADCYLNTSGTAATLAVDTPASIPEVTGVGGTRFNEGSGTYWNALNDANRASALSYIPETAWNDSSGGNLASSGGGVSSFFPKPAWQSGAGVPNDGARNVPDIALSASAQHVGYLIYQNGNLQAIGGTSAGAPAFAGIVALLNQYQVANGLQPIPGMGNVNPRLYAMAVSTPNAFHDITTGNNVVNPCSPRMVVCPSGPIGYQAATGYDLVTGLGTIDAFNLILGWGGSGVLKSSVSVTLTSSVTSAPQNGTTVLTAVVTSTNGGTPTGTVSFFAGTTQLGTVTLSGSAGRATAALTVPASRFSPGTTSFTARYNGDTAYNAGTSPAVLVGITAATGIVVTGAVNAASFKLVVAPGMILAVFGAHLAGAAQSAASVPLPTTLAGVTATINETPVPLYYVSATQINLQVPHGMPAGAATLRVTYNGQSATSVLAIAPVAPGIFMNSANGSPVPDQAAKRGQTISLYITGDGASTPLLVSGNTPPAGVTPRPVQTVTVAVGGIPANVTYLGVPSWSVGVTQVNYTVPVNVPLGAVLVTVTVGGVASAPVTLAVIP